jgi:hypothetical protein
MEVSTENVQDQSSDGRVRQEVFNARLLLAALSADHPLPCRYTRQIKRLRLEAPADCRQKSLEVTACFLHNEQLCVRVADDPVVASSQAMALNPAIHDLLVMPSLVLVMPSLVGMNSPWCETWNPPWDLGAEKFVLRAKGYP